ncbi:MAG: hypothetical protein PHV78_04105 [Patescibacteria group bacterium]|nr:hypothetical protein [Patescibacteria group bacterium]MDD5121741.1 hypothetical protein [Patescibacteria group bacterium]MDD5222284.1 hypothetical protein [Patescibacteria group bacterium]MDD5396407.1 hypothetical protein [Patescibacteria group bacterium]
MPVGILLWPEKRVPGASQPNVVVRIRRVIVQVQVERSGIGPIVPVTATNEHVSALTLSL